MLQRQRRAAERLRRELMELDGSHGHRYFKTFERQLRGGGSALETTDLYLAASLVDLIYVGDFHALPASQRLAADLLEQVAARVPRLALGVEFIYTRQQRVLDRRQSGALDDPAFLKRIHYGEEWGYPWEGYRELLDRARAAGVPVFALDAPPRGGYSGLRRRDDHAARRIAAILESDPQLRLLVLFGETHLARPHLPRRVKSRLKKAGLERRELVVFQNPDPLYWQLVARGLQMPASVRIDNTTCAVFHSTPLEKYEAYRQVLERWSDDVPQDEEIDLTPAVHHLIGVLAGWIGIRPEQRRVRHRAGWSEELADAYPEVYGGTEASELIGSILAEHGRTAEEIEAARRRLAECGALYDSRSNTLFLARYLPGAAAGEGARFLRAALTGRLFISPEDFADDPAQTAYGAAYTEALAYLGARLVDPTSVYPTLELAPLQAAAGSAGGTGVEGSHRLWLDEHRRMELRPRARPSREMLGQLRESRPLRRLLAQDLGRRLGAALYNRVRSEDLGRRDLRRLFTRPLQPRSAAGFVLRLLRGRRGA